MYMKNKIEKYVLIIGIFIMISIFFTSCNTKTAKTDEKFAMLLKTEDNVYKQTINAAHHLKNCVNGGFTDQNRNALQISNKNISLIHNINQNGRQNFVAQLNNAVTNENILKNTMDIVIVDTLGREYRASGNSSAIRGNIDSPGLYNSDMTIKNIDFISKGLDTDLKTGSIILIDDESAMKKWRGLYNHCNLEYKDNSMLMTVTNPADPFIGMTTLKIDLLKQADIALNEINDIFLDIIKIRARGSGITTLSIYFSTNKIGLSEETRETFTVSLDSEYKDILLTMTNPNWKDQLKVLRIDVDGAQENAYIEIESIEFCYLQEKVIPIAAQKTFHTYADKIYQEFNFDVLQDFEISEIYFETVIRNLKYTDLEIGVGGEKFNEFYGSYDRSKIDYIGFSLTDKSTFGIIPIFGNDYGKIDIFEKDSEATVRQYIKTENNQRLFKTGEKISMECRYYLSESGGFNELEAAANEERMTLDIAEINVSGNGVFFHEYDRINGCYSFHLDKSDGNEYPFININFKNNDFKKIIYVKINETMSEGTLQGAVVTDVDGNVLPIPVQLNKNLKDEKNPQVYGLFPIYLDANEELSIKAAFIYENWGEYNAMQIVGYSGETPSFGLSDGKILTDKFIPNFRNGINGIILSEHNALTKTDGKIFQSALYGEIFEYTDIYKKTQYMKYTSSKINSIGSVYTDFTMFFESTDNKVKNTLRFVQFPQKDNKTFVYSEIEFNQEVKIKDLQSNMRIWKFIGKHERIGKFSYYSEKSDIVTEQTVEPIGNSVNISTDILNKDNPFIALYEFENNENYADDIILIRNFSLTKGGQPIEKKLHIAYSDREKNIDGETVNSVWLTIDDDEDEFVFQKGDKMILEFVLMPTKNTEDTVAKALNLRSIYSKDFEIKNLKSGTIIENFTIPTIRIDNPQNGMEFTISGGDEYAAVNIEGFTSHVIPNISINGIPKIFDGNVKDGYNVYVDDNGYFGFSFVVPSGDEVQITDNR